MTSQSMQALAHANEIRLRRHRMRREIRAGNCDVIDVITDTPDYAATMTIDQLLRAQKYWANGRVGVLLHRANVWPNRRLADLTERQRRSLIRSIREYRGKVAR